MGPPSPPSPPPPPPPQEELNSLKDKASLEEVQRNEKAKQIKKNHSKLRTNKLLNNIFSCLEEEPTLEGCDETIELEVPNMLKKQKKIRKMTKPIKKERKINTKF